MISNRDFLVNYRVVNKIGEGSFSEVLKCQKRKTSVRYAAKILKKTFNRIEDVLECAEVVAMQKILPHPNILNPLEYYYNAGSGKLILIFELMDMSLYDLMKIKKRGISENRSRFYLYEVLKGLNHLHKMGLFHRDVKPENILISASNRSYTFPYGTQCERVKLADMGSIRGIYSKPPYTEYISTRWYRAPECLLTKGYYGPKMDIWAAGCVFYELLTLNPLFPGSNEIDQLAKIHNVMGTPPARVMNKLVHKSQNFHNFPKQRGMGLMTLVNSFSDGAKSLLKLMLEYDPDKRATIWRLLGHGYFSEITNVKMVKRPPEVPPLNLGNKRKQSTQSTGRIKVADSHTHPLKNFSICMHSIPKKMKINST